jgi:hypothetical protein
MPKAKKSLRKTEKKIPKAGFKSEVKVITATKQSKTVNAKMPNSFRLMVDALKILRDHWKLFLGIIIIYGLVSLLLGQSLSSNTISQAKANLGGGTKGMFGGLWASTIVFASISNALDSSSNGVPGAYQVVITISATLAIIWALRNAYAKNKVRIRDAYYKGMYPLVPFILLLLLVLVQVVPVIVGLALYGIVKNGVATPGLEITLWVILLFALLIWSIYMLTVSLISLYIVCLPDMAPIAAIKSAKELVKGQRWSIMRKIIFLPVFIFIMEGIIIIPIILIATPMAQLALFFVSMADLLVINSYMYRLYRALL